MSSIHPEWIVPDWPVSQNVRALFTTRAGGQSQGPYAAGDGSGGMNLGLGSGDDQATVLANRARLQDLLPAEPYWLTQVHGAVVVDVGDVRMTPASATQSPADAAVAHRPGAVCAVLVADCMPVLLASVDGHVVGAAHAGWRGVAAGVIQNTVAAMRRDVAGLELIAWLGPAIGPHRFEVGVEVLEAMSARLPDAPQCFRPTGVPGKYLADLPALGRLCLREVGVTRVYGGGECTMSDAERFYSFRRDRITGRHAALIWRIA